MRAAPPSLDTPLPTSSARRPGGAEQPNRSEMAIGDGSADKPRSASLDGLGLEPEPTRGPGTVSLTGFVQEHDTAAKECLSGRHRPSLRADAGEEPCASDAE